MMFSETPIVPHSRLAVGGVEQDPGDRAGAVGFVEDADLVVGQLDVGEVRVAVGDRAAQGAVEGVDRAVALGDAHVALAVDLDLDRRLGLDLAAGALLGDDAEALEPEQRLVAARLAAQQQLEGGRRRLVVVAAVLALLQPLDRPRRAVVVELQPGPLGLAADRRLAGQLGGEDVALVADQRPGRGARRCGRRPRSRRRACRALWAKALRPT